MSGKLWLFLLLSLLSGCQSPFLVFAGGQLEGKAGQTRNFAFAAQYRLLQLETANAYSVLLRVTVLDGELFIDAAPNRRWARHLEQNQNVRIKLGDTVYRAYAWVVEEPEILDRFLPGRRIYRIEPRIEPKPITIGTES